MCVSRRLAVGPQVVAIALMGLGAAGCSDSGRFSDIFSDNSSRNEVTGSLPPNAANGRVDSRPMTQLAGNDGISGGGRGMGSYQPGSSEITGSVSPAAPPPPTWTWEGGTAISVAPGETLETISRRYGVPVGAIMHANGITTAAAVHPGQHLVIPRYRASAAGMSQPDTHVATTAAVPSATTIAQPRRNASVHVVAPGETLNSIARLYGKPVLVLAKANNIPPDAMVKVGDRIVIPDVRAPLAAVPVAPRADVPAVVSESQNYAAAESPHSARLATPAAPAGQESAVKTAEPAGGLPSFRWPVRGRVIAGFGPTPNGLQNDGINLAVPEGTPVKAAEDGVVAYAGNELKGYGNLVLVRHGNGFVTAYAHASEILVKRGDEVKRGQVIARSGQSGNVTSPQLHFEIRKGATPVDPAQYLNGA